MSDQQWYFEHNQQRLGPFRTSALHQLATVGLIQSNILIYDGAGQCFHAEDIVECFPAPPPPPLSDDVFKSGIAAGTLKSSNGGDSDVSIRDVFAFFGSFLPSAATIGSLLFFIFVIYRLCLFLKLCWDSLFPPI